MFSAGSKDYSFFLPSLGLTARRATAQDLLSCPLVQVPCPVHGLVNLCPFLSLVAGSAAVQGKLGSKAAWQGTSPMEIGSGARAAQQHEGMGARCQHPGSCVPQLLPQRLPSPWSLLRQAKGTAGTRALIPQGWFVEQQGAAVTGGCRAGTRLGAISAASCIPFCETAALIKPKRSLN